ncbi:ChrR family anti-sigma-E factor [Aurantivibrio plasticivorans]
MTNESILHHPSQELLVSYAAGSCSTSQALCIATHLEFCAKCRALHNRNNAIGGALLDTAASSTHSVSSINPRSKSRVMELIANRQTEGGQALAPQTPEPLTKTEPSPRNQLTPSKQSATPRALRKLVPDGLSSIRWKMATLSVKTSDLFKDHDGTNVSLLKIKAGGKVGKHRHLGDEYTVILQGSFSDETGVYKKGDFLLRDANQQHTPVATKDTECICLTAQEAPLQFTGKWWSVFNPFLRKAFTP